MNLFKRVTHSKLNRTKRNRQQPSRKRPSKPTSGFGKLSLLLLLLLSTLFILEIQFQYVERIIGRFLNDRNEGREAFGTTWERREQSELAEEILEQEAGEANAIRRKAERVNSFAELLNLIPVDDFLSLSPDKFIELYLNLPVALQSLLIDQSELTNFRRGDSWQRTSIWRQGENGAAYLIDSQNQILKHINISKAFLNAAGSYGVSTRGSLSEMPQFVGHIYPADKFNKLFFSLPDAKRNAFFPEPSILLKLPKNITYVGLTPSENLNDLGIVGFESETADGNMVVTYPASADMMQQFIWKFSWEGSDTLFRSDQNSPDSLRNSDVTNF